jgi:hypothetical protein
LQFGVILCKKTRKSIKRYAKMQNKCTKTCAFQIIVVSLHQKKKQITIKPQDPEGQRDYDNASIQGSPTQRKDHLQSQRQDRQNIKARLQVRSVILGKGVHGRNERR